MDQLQMDCLEIRIWLGLVGWLLLVTERAILPGCGYCIFFYTIPETRPRNTTRLSQSTPVNRQVRSAGQPPPPCSAPLSPEPARSC